MRRMRILCLCLLCALGAVVLGASGASGGVPGRLRVGPEQLRPARRRQAEASFAPISVNGLTEEVLSVAAGR